MSSNPQVFTQATVCGYSQQDLDQLRSKELQEPVDQDLPMSSQVVKDYAAWALEGKPSKRMSVSGTALQQGTLRNGTYMPIGVSAVELTSDTSKAHETGKTVDHYALVPLLHPAQYLSHTHNKTVIKPFCLPSSLSAPLHGVCKNENEEIVASDENKFVMRPIHQMSKNYTASAYHVMAEPNAFKKIKVMQSSLTSKAQSLFHNGNLMLIQALESLARPLNSDEFITLQIYEIPGSFAYKQQMLVERKFHDSPVMTFEIHKINKDTFDDVVESIQDKQLKLLAKREEALSKAAELEESEDLGTESALAPLDRYLSSMSDDDAMAYRNQRNLMRSSFTELSPCSKEPWKITAWTQSKDSCLTTYNRMLARGNEFLNLQSINPDNEEGYLQAAVLSYPVSDSPDELDDAVYSQQTVPAKLLVIVNEGAAKFRALLERNNPSSQMPISAINITQYESTPASELNHVVQILLNRSPDVMLDSANSSTGRQVELSMYAKHKNSWFNDRPTIAIESNIFGAICMPFKALIIPSPAAEDLATCAKELNEHNLAVSEKLSKPNLYTESVDAGKTASEQLISQRQLVSEPTLTESLSLVAGKARQEMGSRGKHDLPAALHNLDAELLLGELVDSSNSRYYSTVNGKQVWSITGKKRVALYDLLNSANSDILMARVLVAMHKLDLQAHLASGVISMLEVVQKAAKSTDLSQLGSDLGIRVPAAIANSAKNIWKKPIELRSNKLDLNKLDLKTAKPEGTLQRSFSAKNISTLSRNNIDAVIKELDNMSLEETLNSEVLKKDKKKKKVGLFSESQMISMDEDGSIDAPITVSAQSGLEYYDSEGDNEDEENIIKAYKRFKGLEVKAAIKPKPKLQQPKAEKKTQLSQPAFPKKDKIVVPPKIAHTQKGVDEYTMVQKKPETKPKPALKSKPLLNKTAEDIVTPSTTNLLATQSMAKSEMHLPSAENQLSFLTQMEELKKLKKLKSKAAAAVVVEEEDDEEEEEEAAAAAASSDEEVVVSNVVYGRYDLSDDIDSKKLPKSRRSRQSADQDLYRSTYEDVDESTATGSGIYSEVDEAESTAALNRLNASDAKESKLGKIKNRFFNKKK